MSRTRVSVVALGLIALVTSGVFAQEKTERRERLRKAAGAAAGLANELARDAATDSAQMIHGSVLVVREKTKGKLEVNAGGLVIVKINDLGSQPAEDISVDGGPAFKGLGQVRPTKMKAGGGETWVLLKAVAEGDATISASYSSSIEGETPSKWQHTMRVTAAE